MKLKLILANINEGVYIKDYSGLTIDEILKAKAKSKGSENTSKRGAGKGGLTDLYMGREYAYRDKDDPSDIVHVEPLNKMTKLPVVPKDPTARQSFKGASIYCAYAIVPSENFEDYTIASGYKDDYTDPVKKITLEKDISKLDSSVKKYYSSFGINTNYRIPVRDFTYANLLNQRNRANARQADEEFETINRILAYIKNNNIDTNFHRLDDIIKKPNKSKPSRLAFTSDHLRYAAQSLAKKIKNPKSESEKEMSEKLTQGAVTNLTRIIPPHDIIIAPASSSTYNDTLIQMIKSQNGWSQSKVIKLSKLTGDEAIDQIDKNSLTERAYRIHNTAREYGSRSNTTLSPQKLAAIRSQTDVKLPTIDMNKPLKADNKAWVEWWVAEKITMAKKLLSRYIGKPIAIKSLAAFDNYKKYLQIFKAEADDLYAMNKKRVLIVDDNVNHQATMQMVYDLVEKGLPSQIVIFTPFYMNALD